MEQYIAVIPGTGAGGGGGRGGGAAPAVTPVNNNPKLLVYAVPN